MNIDKYTRLLTEWFSSSKIITELLLICVNFLDGFCDLQLKPWSTYIHMQSYISRQTDYSFFWVFVKLATINSRKSTRGTYFKFRRRQGVLFQGSCLIKVGFLFNFSQILVRYSHFTVTQSIHMTVLQKSQKDPVSLEELRNIIIFTRVIGFGQWISWSSLLSIICNSRFAVLECANIVCSNISILCLLSQYSSVKQG